jgi:hypothetical protein
MSTSAAAVKHAHPLLHPLLLLALLRLLASCAASTSTTAASTCRRGHSTPQHQRQHEHPTLFQLGSPGLPSNGYF